MEDDHHQVGGWQCRIETWKLALNLSFLTTNINCLQENLIVLLHLTVTKRWPVHALFISLLFQVLFQAIHVYQPEKHSTRGIFPQEGHKQYPECSGS